MTSCCEKVFVSVSSPQGISHVNASCFGLRISKIFEGSVRISLEEESSTLDDEISALEEESSALDEDTTLLDEENVSLEDETATLDEEDSSAGSLEDERISDQASNALEESSPHAIIKSKAPKGNIFRFINVSLTVFTTVKYTPFIKHSQYFYETKHRFFYKIRHFYKISI